MDFKTIAADMYPFWLLGIVIIAMVIAGGKKQLLRVEKRPVITWSLCMILLTVWRIFLFKIGYNGFHGASTGMLMIPWVASFTVFWEDICHGLPLAIFQDLIGDKQKKWWAKISYGMLMAMIMFSFGLGHLYQGLWAGILLAIYIPYSVDMGRRYGFGTIVICHTMYDLVTLIYAHHWLASSIS